MRAGAPDPKRAPSSRQGCRPPTRPDPVAAGPRRCRSRGQKPVRATSECLTRVRGEPPGGAGEMRSPSPLPPALPPRPPGPTPPAPSPGIGTKPPGGAGPAREAHPRPFPAHSPDSPADSPALPAPPQPERPAPRSLTATLPRAGDPDAQPDAGGDGGRMRGPGGRWRAALKSLSGCKAHTEACSGGCSSRQWESIFTASGRLASTGSTMTAKRFFSTRSSKLSLLSAAEGNMFTMETLEQLRKSKPRLSWDMGLC